VALLPPSACRAGCWSFQLQADGRNHAFHVCKSGVIVKVDARDAFNVSPYVISGEGTAASPQGFDDDIVVGTGNNAQISDHEGTLYPNANFNQADLINAMLEPVLDAIHLRGGGPGALLEVGCGPGLLLNALREALPPGWEFVGVDPSPISVSQGRNLFGLDIREGTLGTADLPERCFDIIVVMGNLSLHMNPLETLRILRQRAAPGSVLYVDVKSANATARIVSAWMARVPVLSTGLSQYLAHSFHGMRFAMTKRWLCAALEATGWDAYKVSGARPRVLSVSNTHGMGRGAAGFVWRMLDKLDRIRGTGAWLQVIAKPM
jgi:SAM-dependent methyltransferase